MGRSAVFSVQSGLRIEMHDEYYYEPSKGHGLPHDPFNAIVGPRPIGWISTQSNSGVLNLAPYSFFNAFNYRPPIIGFASVGWKDTVANVHATGEFCWNLATRELSEKVNLCSASVAPEVDEFSLTGLTPAPSRIIRTPRVLEARTSFECRLTQLIQLQGVDKATVNTWLILGEVIAVHIDRALIVDGVYQTATARPILRAGGPAGYAEIRESNMFEMHRPN
jgi:flavin reductase (DIM6/NTAB) family NADH-FMN oxidoreductase RutF